jgi:uncharacterized protein (DUF2235 family)
MSNSEGTPRLGKRLALFFGGTWNESPDHTNVRRLRLMLAEHGADGVEQRAFYNAGVGTRWYDRRWSAQPTADLAAKQGGRARPRLPSPDRQRR